MKDRKKLAPPAVAAFLDQVATTAPAVKASESTGRLLFALDATASRQPTWDQACNIQSQMFDQTAALGGLAVQLCYYRGYREFYTSRWVNDPRALLDEMTATQCLGGQTQIKRVLRHAVSESTRYDIGTLVFVGDCFEEDIDQVCQVAGELGARGVPAFMFHEGGGAIAERAFRQIAKLTRGAYSAFDSGSAQQLRDLLGAVAVYTAGGVQALEALQGQAGGLATRLVNQLKE